MLGGPEETGRRLLPHVLAYQTAKSPKETFATIPLVLNDHRGPWYDFTFEDLTRAVDYTAWWIDGHLVDGEAGDIVAYLGVSDIRYFVVFLACMKTGRVVSLLGLILYAATWSEPLIVSSRPSYRRQETASQRTLI